MLGKIVLGFIAAAIAVLLVHQPLLWLFHAIGWVPQFRPYNMAPFAGAPAFVKMIFTPLGLGGFPTIFNLVFWGGVWGALFALIHQWLPGGSMLLKGLVFGLLLVIISNWIVLPLLRGQPLFAGFAAQRLMVGGLLQMAFGAATALIYSALRREEA